MTFSTKTIFGLLLGIFAVSRVCFYFDCPMVGTFLSFIVAGVPFIVRPA